MAYAHVQSVFGIYQWRPGSGWRPVMFALAGVPLHRFSGDLFMTCDSVDGTP